MKASVYKSGWYFICVLLWLIAGTILLLTVPKKELFMAIYSRHSPTADVFFIYFTHLGLGGVAFGALLLCGLHRLRYAVTGIAALLIVAGLVQTMKQVLFTTRYRPTREWPDIAREIDGFVPYINNSFPSGHTATAFCLFTLMALYYRFPGSGFLYFALATGVGYSRIYLAQHHFLDVYTGSIIGVFAALLSYRYLYTEAGFLKSFSARLDKPLFRLK
ncbi:MAG: phosphatase PAP2 family protein [Bacteroidota bacterium]|nr:phosphatase PAP2 family protein [Bacteroidota bacterium]